MVPNIFYLIITNHADSYWFHFYVTGLFLHTDKKYLYIKNFSKFKLNTLSFVG